MSKSADLFFADGIENLSYTAGAFRFDLASIKPWSKKDPNPEQQPQAESLTQAHVVMTPQGFIQTIKAMENFMKLVEQKGIIRLNDPADANISAEPHKKNGDGK